MKFGIVLAEELIDGCSVGIGQSLVDETVTARPILRENEIGILIDDLPEEHTLYFESFGKLTLLCYLPDDRDQLVLQNIDEAKFVKLEYAANFKAVLHAHRKPRHCVRVKSFAQGLTSAGIGNVLYPLTDEPLSTNNEIVWISTLAVENPAFGVQPEEQVRK